MHMHLYYCIHICIVYINSAIHLSHLKLMTCTSGLGKQRYIALLYSPLSFPVQPPCRYNVVFSISLNHPVYIKVRYGYGEDVV